MQKKVKDIEWENVQRQLHAFFKTGIMNEGFVCYAAGMGGLPKSVYLELESRKDVDVIRMERYGANSVFQKILSVILPSYWGVMKIKNISYIDTIFDKLTEQTMGELYLLNRKEEAVFLSKIQTVNSPLEISEYIKQLPDFFMYQLDADNVESETGMLEIISYGDNCPKSLVDIVELIFFR